MQRTLLTMILGFSSLILFGQAQRLVLVEEFSNASCPPCEAQNPAFDALMEQNTDKAVLLKYQVWWPGFDPMYEQNPEDAEARVDYYGVSGVPNVRVDGSLNAGTANSVSQLMIDQRYAETTPLEMTISHQLSSDLTQVDILLKIHNVSSDTFDATSTVAQVALIEENINFDEPPGSTSEVHFLHVVRKMIPNAMGTPISNILPGDSIVLEFEGVEVPNYIYNFEEFGVACFVQNNISKNVYQAAISNSYPLASNYPDVSAQSFTASPDGYCDYELIPQLVVMNENTIQVTEFLATFQINGNAIESQTWNGTLAQGEQAEINFSTYLISDQRVDVAFTISNVNGTTDFNQQNNLIPVETYYTLSQTPTRETFTEGFDIQEIGDLPGDIILVNPDDIRAFTVNSSISADVTWDLGGFGNSDGCFRWDYWAITAGTEATLVFDKADVRNLSNLTLSFAHAYAQYETGGRGTNDGLEVLASVDCGENWISLFDKAGADLATMPAPVTSARFYPRPDNWVSDTLDLSAFDGADELVIAFRGYSDFGNSLYLDDINLFENATSSLGSIKPIDGEVLVFPNPVKRQLNVQLDLKKPDHISISVKDLSGRTIAVISDQTYLMEGQHVMELREPLPAGIYFLVVQTPETLTTRKFTVLD